MGNVESCVCFNTENRKIDGEFDKHISIVNHSLEL